MEAFWFSIRSCNPFLELVAALLIYTLRTFSSSAPSGVLSSMMERFGFGDEVATLTVSLFVAGYCLGPLIWGPLSEDVSCFRPVSPPLVRTYLIPPLGWAPPSLLNNALVQHGTWSTMPLLISLLIIACIVSGSPNWLRALAKCCLHLSVSVPSGYFCRWSSN